MSKKQKEEEFEDYVKWFFNELERPAILLKNRKTKEFAIIYSNCEQDYPLYVFFASSEEDLQPGVQEDRKASDVDLTGFEVVDVKRGEEQ